MDLEGSRGVPIHKKIYIIFIIFLIIILYINVNAIVFSMLYILLSASLMLMMPCHGELSRDAKSDEV